MRIPLSQPSITALEKRYVNEALEDGWISGTGNFVTRFENALAEKVGRKYAIAVANGTVALEVALRAMGIGAGDEVIVPALTFVAPAAAVRNVGATPVFADIYANTWNISAGSVIKLTTEKTRAIIAVDVLGNPCHYGYLDTINPVIPVIEDAAEAHGAMYENRPCGSFGGISTFSFHANKALTGGELGAILTDNPEMASLLRILVNHGMTSERPYWHDIVGTNARTNNLSAAIGLAQVERWNELTEKRQQVAAWYDEFLRETFENTLLWRRPVADYASESCWLYTLHHPQRNEIVGHLRARGIDSRAIWTPLCDLPVYKDSCRGEYEITRHVGYGAFWLPTFAAMTREQVREVAEAVKEAVASVK